jgi:hypothetical membrane protein
VSLTRGLLLCGVVGPPLFIGTFLIAGATRPGYDGWRNYVSSLATGDGGWVQIANFILWGVLALAFSIGLLRRRVVGPGVLVVLYGVAMIAVGVYVTDQSLGYPPGPPLPQPTTHARIHGVAALAVFLLNAVAAAVTAAHFASDRRARGFVRYSALTGLVVLAFFLLSTVAGTLDERGQWPNSPTGVFQRISIIGGLAWFAVFALRLSRDDVPPAPAR